MNQLLQICVMAAVLVTAGGCADEAPRTTTQERVISFGQPSVAHIGEDTQAEALTAYGNAIRFISDEGFDVSSFDLMKPGISHWCPPQVEYHDWLVSFPRANPDADATSPLSIAVLNDGQCWVWPRTRSEGEQEDSQEGG